MSKIDKSVFRHRKCNSCGKDLSGQDHGCREYDSKGDWTGKWLCHQCHNKFRYISYRDNQERRKKESELTLEYYEYKKAKMKKELEGRMCCICRGVKTDIDSYGRYVWRSCNCSKKSCTGFLCNNCYGKVRYRNLDGSYVAKWRIGELDPLSTTGKGFIGQQIVAKTYNVEDCNLKMDNFRFYVDLSDINEYGYGEVKTATLIAHEWHFGNLDRSCDTFFFICMDRYVPMERYKKDIYCS